MERREFLKAGAAAGVTCAVTGLAAGENPPALSTIPRRPYGDTGVELSVIGFGGIVVMNAEPDHAARVVSEAVERSVNYFDVAPSYGNSEEKLGPALEPYRKDVFLACKTGERGYEGAKAEFEQSLQRLRTDRFDLYQLHGLVDVAKDVDAAFARGGAMEFISERKKAGQIRFVGFSVHTIEAALAAMDRYDFDSVLFPVNFACAQKNAWGPQIMQRAREKNIARLALKGMARQRWSKDDPKREQYPKCWYEPVTDPDEASRALRWTLAQPITAAIPPGEEALFRLAMDVASRPLALTPEEEGRLMASAGELAPIFPTT